VRKSGKTEIIKLTPEQKAALKKALVPVQGKRVAHRQGHHRRRL
jgi:hypothetical protein